MDRANISLGLGAIDSRGFILGPWEEERCARGNRSKSHVPQSRRVRASTSDPNPAVQIELIVVFRAICKLHDQHRSHRIVNFDIALPALVRSCGDLMSSYSGITVCIQKHTHARVYTHGELVLLTNHRPTSNDVLHREASARLNPALRLLPALQRFACRSSASLYSILLSPLLFFLSRFSSSFFSCWPRCPRGRILRVPVIEVSSENALYLLFPTFALSRHHSSLSSSFLLSFFTFFFFPGIFIQRHRHSSTGSLHFGINDMTYAHIYAISWCRYYPSEILPKWNFDKPTPRDDKYLQQRSPNGERRYLRSNEMSQ